MLEGLLLKASMVTSGLDCSEQATAEEVAAATIKCFLRSVPAATAGIVFLSGGQSGTLACKHLNAMHVKYESTLPWPLTFCFGRAIQEPALSIWQGRSDKVHEVQQALSHRAQFSKSAVAGEYDATIDQVRTVTI